MPLDGLRGRKPRWRILFLGCIIWILALVQARAAATPLHRVLSQGHIPPAVAQLTPLGSLPGGKRLKLAIGLPLRNQVELDRLLAQLYDPASPGYHRYLAPEDFAARFGPSKADYQALMDFAESNGLSVTVTHPNRVVLDVEGQVTDIQKAFHVTLRVYRHPQEARDFYAPSVEPTVASPIPILHVSGLDDYWIRRPNFRIQPAGIGSGATAHMGSGPGGTYRGYDFRNAYVPGTPLTGAGQTVGLVQFDAFYANDITAYASEAGLPNIPLTVVPIDGGVSTPGSGNGEVCLDIQMVMSMAPGLSRIYVYEAPNPSPWVDVLNRMATDNLSKQLSCSWGGGGPDATAEQVFKQMAVQGQSFFNATGDSDAFTGSISFPSDSPNITEVGGTTLTTGAAAAYESETVWNWGNGQGSSGGASTFYAIPSYQQGLNMAANQGSTTMRNVPDVALTADNVYVIYNNGSTGTFGGTSCAAPLWAGFTALMNEQAIATGQPAVGFLNPALYELGQSAEYAFGFHDTTTGNNFSSSSPTRYSAVAGYDLCTGWGTPNGTNVINILTAPPVPTPFIISNSFVLIVEGCTNSAVDPAESVTANLSLKNAGTADTTNLVATLLATNGIVFPSGPQTYGVLGTNGLAVSQPFTFTATGGCGDTNIALLHLQDGASDLGTVAFAYRLGQLVETPVFWENFDAVAAPVLPAGWTTSATGAESEWVTTTVSRNTIPNSTFSPDPPTVGLNELSTPLIAVPEGSARLTFRQSYNLEATYDGGVLEIAIGGGAWMDILDAGGHFLSGGYVGTLSSAYGNPLAGRNSWNGNSSGFITTVVDLPPGASGQTIQMRWRCGSDSSVSKTGWYVDTIGITNRTYVCCTPSTDLAVSLTASPDPVIAGTDLNYTLTVSNLGPATASSVTLTDTLPADVAFVSASPGCSNIGDLLVVCAVGSLPSGAASNFTVVVVPLAGGLFTNTLTAASPTPDPDSTNNTAVAVTTVNEPAGIAVQPASRAVIPGSNVTFAVTATGNLPLSYQWRFNGTNLEGSTKASLTLTNVQVPQAGTYTVLVTNDFGSRLSSNAVLTVLDPWILTQPKNQSVLGGSSANFTVGAVGTAPLSYQWLKDGAPLSNGTNLSGADTETLTIQQVGQPDAGTYRVIVSNQFGQVQSSNATLIAQIPATIVAQPFSQTLPAGSTVLFTAVVAGSGPISLQWQLAGTNLAEGGKFSGTMTSTLVVSNVQAAEMGDYSLLVTNAYGSATSSNARLALWPLVEWGRNDSGQTDIPGGLTSVRAVAAGLFHSLALKDDGTVVAWGAGTTDTGVSPEQGQSIVPAGLSNVLQVAGGYYHSLALKDDGTVAAWGAGTTNLGTTPQLGQARVPDGLSNVVSVAAGGYHSLAITSGGTVAAWGAGVTSTGISPDYGQAMVPESLTNVAAVSAGGFHSLALKRDGTVVGWGAGATNTDVNPDFGQAMVPEGLSNVLMIAAGGYHSLALRSDGTVVAWGDNRLGQTNTPTGLSNVISVAAERFGSLALKSDGTMAAWGDNTFGETNLPLTVSNVVGIAGGGFHALALQGDGRPRIVAQPAGQTVAVGADVAFSLTAAGTMPLVYQWTFAGTNLPGATTESLLLTNVQPDQAGAYAVVVSNTVGVATSEVATLTVLLPPSISSCTVSGSVVSVTFPTMTGATYVLEYKRLLDDPAWSNLVPPVVGTGSTASFADTNAPVDSRYYRLRRE